MCGGGNQGRWQLWIPSILTNDTMLYAQGFSATLHYQLWTGQVHTAEALALKDQAVTRINHSLNDPATVASDATVGSVLCLAFATNLEVCHESPPQFSLALESCIKETTELSFPSERSHFSQGDLHAC